MLPDFARHYPERVTLRPSDGPPVILSPHFDDAVLSCWTVLREGPAKVVNVFAEPPPPGVAPSTWDRTTGGGDAREHTLARRREDADVLGELGAVQVNLPFLSGDYRGREQDAGPLLKALQPHVAGSRAVFAPAGIGRHPEHFAVRAAAVALHKRGTPVTLYAELPYCCHYGWPHWVTGAEPDRHLDLRYDWERSLRLGEVSLAAESGKPTPLSPEERERKLAAVQGYRTQWPGMARLLSHEDALGWEVFWPLDPLPQSRLRSIRQELLWRAGARRGSRLERALRRPALRRLRALASSRL